MLIILTCSTPDGTDAQTFWKVLKGKVDKDPQKSMIVRAEFAVPASKKYTVVGFVRNVFDDIGYQGGAAATRLAGFNGATPVLQGIESTYSITPPRTYGVELQYRFF